MKKLQFYPLLKYFIRWTILVLPVAMVIGSLVAFFLWLLNLAIHYRFQHPMLLFLLPLAGLGIYFLYRTFGKNAEKGNNLIIEEIHNAESDIPKRMTPLILGTTVITHLFGGSAGREGTAVQIGGSIAEMFGRLFKLGNDERPILLTAGIAAGFAAVFGTPFTGAIFALEVLTIGRIKYTALFPALIASIVADRTLSVWNVEHTVYTIEKIAKDTYWLSDKLPINPILLLKVIIASCIFGLASLLFSGMVEQLKTVFNRLFKIKWLIPVFGGLSIIALTYLNGKQDYLSLGIDAQYAGAITIPSAFQQGGADTWSWLWKTIYTAVTLATGFKGGEVTPLFYIGATLGNALAELMTAPVGLFAGLGFIAVFAGATNTPIACSVMGIELFGPEYIIFFIIACFTAYLFSGHSGIYSAQRNTVHFKDEDFSWRHPLKRRRYLHIKLDKYRIGRKTN